MTVSNYFRTLTVATATVLAALIVVTLTVADSDGSSNPANILKGLGGADSLDAQEGTGNDTADGGTMYPQQGAPGSRRGRLADKLKC